MAEIEKNIQLLLQRTSSLQSMQKELTEVNTKLTNLNEAFETKLNILDDRITKVESTQTELEKSQKFLSSQFETNKTVTNNITKTNIKLEKENTILQNQIRSLYNDLEEERAVRNEENQYHRTSLNFKILGVPLQLGEDKVNAASNNITTGIVAKLAEMAKIDNFTLDDIDVSHRVGKTKYSPIIVRFKTKAKRMNFFHQKKKFYNLNQDQYDTFYGPEEVAFGDEKEAKNDDEYRYIQIVESLTNFNANLLKMVKEKTKGLNYEFPGYIINGQIRVKKTEASKYTVIRKKSDIDKLS